MRLSLAAQDCPPSRVRGHTMMVALATVVACGSTLADSDAVPGQPLMLAARAEAAPGNAARVTPANADADGHEPEGDGDEAPEPPEAPEAPEPGEDVHRDDGAPKGPGTNSMRPDDNGTPKGPGISSARHEPDEGSSPGSGQGSGEGSGEGDPDPARSNGNDGAPKGPGS